jgi:glycosyltransferase involved in cell wall biosynthesis
MKIGIDARLIDGKGGGTKVYAISLIRNLLRFNDRNYFFLYTYPNHPNLINIVKGFNSVSIRVIKNKAFWYFLLPFILYKEGIDIFLSPAYRLPLIFIKLKRPKYVCVFHGIDFEFYKKRKGNLIWRISARIHAMMSDIVVSLSDKQKEEIIDRFKIHADKLRVIYYGFEELKIENYDLNQVLSKYNIPIEKSIYLLLCVDGNEPRKNLPTVFKALNILYNELGVKNIRLIATRALIYKSYATKYKLEGVVDLYDWIDNNDLHYLYLVSDLVIYPSLYEGIGFPVIESICFNKPIIIYYNSPMADLVNDPRLFVYNPFSSEELAKKIYELLTNSNLRREISEIFKEKCKLFRPESITKQFYKLFEEMYGLRRS